MASYSVVLASLAKAEDKRKLIGNSTLSSFGCKIILYLGKKNLVKRTKTVLFMRSLK